MTRDTSMSESALYGSEAWCAVRLGKSLAWFRRHRAKLESEGFPARDPLTKGTVKADVDRWVQNRRQSRDKPAITNQPSNGVNPDAF